MKRRVIEIVSMMVFMIAMLCVVNTQRVKAVVKPSVREESVTIYTDADPYVFHYFNLFNPTSVTYTSSDNSIVAIKDSEAVPQKAGKATVSIEIVQDSITYNFSVKFTVKNPPAEKTKTDYKKAAEKEQTNLKKKAITKRNTRLLVNDDQICTTKAELDKVMYENIYRYSYFAIYIDSFGVLRSTNEYKNMFPLIKKLKFSEATVYDNTILVKVKSEIDGIQYLYDDEWHVLYTLSGGKVSYLSKDEKRMYDTIRKIAKSLKGTSDYETVLNIHDYIVRNYEYEYDEAKSERYKVSYMLNNGKGVCGSYSKLFYLLCTSLGLNSKCVYGTEEFNHGWNMVEIAHKWYLVDVTWDDPGNDEITGEPELRYDYFLIPDEIMQIDHTWDSTLYPECTSKDLALLYTNIEQHAVLKGKDEAIEYVVDQMRKHAYIYCAEFVVEFAETEGSERAWSALCEGMRGMMDENGLYEYGAIRSVSKGSRYWTYQIKFYR